MEKYENIKVILDSKELDHVKGRLEIKDNKYSTQYFHVISDNKKKTSNYIPKDNIQLAKNLAHNTYLKKVQKLTVKRIKQLKQILKDFSDTELDDLYENLNENRKMLVDPIIPTNKQKFEEWKREKHTGKAFYPDSINIITNKGERVRSKSEKIYADKFFSLGIEYKYEYPLQIDQYSLFHPDFTFFVNGKIIYWEHFGMMDDPNYAVKAIRKIALYEKNGIHIGKNLIVTFESSRSGIDEELLDILIKKYLM